MKRVMNVPKLTLNVSLLFMLLIPIFCKADVNSNVWISNCYQKVHVDSGKKIKLLQGGGGLILSTYPAGTGFTHFTIRQYNADSGRYVYLNFPRPYIMVPHPPGGSFIRAFERSNSLISIPSTQPVIIDFYANSSPYYTSLRDVSVEFISASEAFKIEPDGQSCFTYKNFSVKNSIVNLEGFCGAIDAFKVKLPDGVPDRMGLPNPFSMNVNMGRLDTIRIDSNRCSNPNSACQANTACGCINFIFEFNLIPCTESQYCPYETLISLPIRICCRCAYTGGGPGGSLYYPEAGRKTDNTALSGQNSELSIFPNPNNTGKLEINAPNSPVRNIKMYAVDGRMVKELSVPELNKVSVDISGLKPGMYQVKVTDISNAVSTKKLIVQ